MLRAHAVPAWQVLGAGLRIPPEGTSHADRFSKMALEGVHAAGGPRALSGSCHSPSMPLPEIGKGQAGRARQSIKTVCPEGRGHKVASQPFCPNTAPAEYTDWILSSSRQPTTDLAHLLLGDQVPIWPLTNFSKIIL